MDQFCVSLLSLLRADHCLIENNVICCNQFFFFSNLPRKAGCGMLLFILVFKYTGFSTRSLVVPFFNWVLVKG